MCESGSKVIMFAASAIFEFESFPMIASQDNYEESKLTPFILCLDFKSVFENTITR